MSSITVWCAPLTGAPRAATMALATRHGRMKQISMAIALLLYGVSNAEAALVNVYLSNTRVTGQREETRLPGLERCFIDQMVKAAGDPRLAEDPEVIAMSKDSNFAIREYAYVDLYAGRPIMDEQGTRDRPYEMTVYYRPDKIDGALARVGSKHWGKDRPKVMVVLKVQHIARNYILTSHGEIGDLMRESLDLASYKYGVPIALVPSPLLDEAGLSFEELTETKLAELDGLATRAEADLALFGTLKWEPNVLGWIADWHMNSNGAKHHWHIEGVNFDAAFRNALAGTAQILSGNGAPK